MTSTFKEVAQLASVSHTTISHIINDYPTHCNASPHNSTRQLCLQC
ncbi:MAG: LacI family DNA-binding transcriptional regulator [Anaerolineae bacterium]|nr:LacI family DNA-binding transcriptional regulator [Anaerolineae bacterium]